MPAGPTQLTGDTVASALSAALPGAVATATAEWVEVEPRRVLDVLRWLHDSTEFDAKQLSNLCAVDRHDRLAVVGDHDEPALPSSYPVYKGALLQEREVYDLMGIRFEGHPDLRRMFLWEGYPGFPLRKDFLQIPDHHPGLPKFPFEEPGVQAR